MLLTTTFPNGMFSIGSGVMVGRNDVLTAAHVIYEPAWGGFASQVVATPAAVVGPPFQAPYSASFARITAADTQFDPNSNRLIEAGNRGPGYVGSERDIVFLTLDIPLGDRTGWMALGPGFKQGYANLSGYPAVHRHALTNDTAWAYDDAVDAFTVIAHPPQRLERSRVPAARGATVRFVLRGGTGHESTCLWPHPSTLLCCRPLKRTL